MDLGLAGTAALVTGASGGIGSAVARELAAEGARVALHYHRNREAAEALAAELGGVALQADLRDEAQADALVPAAVEALGRLDACVANAGVWPSEDVPVARLPLERWRATIDANLTATFLTARAFCRHVEAVGLRQPGPDRLHRRPLRGGRPRRLRRREGRDRPGPGAVAQERGRADGAGGARERRRPRAGPCRR